MGVDSAWNDRVPLSTRPTALSTGGTRGHPDFDLEALETSRQLLRRRCRERPVESRSKLQRGVVDDLLHHEERSRLAHAWKRDELLTVLVFEVLACGELPIVKYAPTAATAITTTTIPAKAVLLTALRLSDEFE